MQAAIVNRPSDPLTPGMRLIPGGVFLMGAEGWGAFEGPVREVFVGDFLMEDVPVTNAAFALFVQATGYRTCAEIRGGAAGYRQGRVQEIAGLCWRSYYIPGRDDHPVVLVSWKDAAAYAQWAGRRLPVEAEWEKAARGGLEQKLYPWGDAEPTTMHCHYGKETWDIPPTASVRSYLPNPFGLYDMAGNVWNWCADLFPYDADPSGAVSRIRRGGAFNVIQPFRLRCANRGAYHPEGFAINIGFRCVKSI